MAIYDLWLSRNGAPVTAANYIGHKGRLFFDDANGVLKLSNGVTPGGLSIPYTIASTSTVGGIKAGPGVTINSEGQLLIDSSGLEFSFGDFQGTSGTYPADYYQVERQNADYAVLSSVNANEDIIFASNGTGSVRAVGDFSVRRANGSLAGALDEEPIFRVRGDGQVQMLVPAADSAEGAFTIVGGLDGVFQAPVNTGVMMHITGIASSPDPTPSRVYNDAQNSFGAFVTRRYNGTAAAPTAVLDGEEILRLSGTAHNGTEIPGTGNQRIIYKALGNQTLTNQGGTMEFWATPLNTTTLAKIATVSSTGITLESGKVLTGNVTGTATTATTATSAATAYSLANTATTYVGRASLADTATTSTSAKIATTATNLAAATGILAGSLSVDPPAMAGKNVSVVGTYTITGLTTSHKVVIMPQSALPDNFNIAGAWASATNTLSINFQSYAGAVDAAAVTIAYFAWV
jgi:hypothetical protein